MLHTNHWTCSACYVLIERTGSRLWAEADFGKFGCFGSPRNQINSCNQSREASTDIIRQRHVQSPGSCACDDTTVGEIRASQFHAHATFSSGYRCCTSPLSSGSSKDCKGFGGVAHTGLSAAKYERSCTHSI